MTDYQMRYAKRKISEEEAREILDAAEYCTISTVDEDGMPYGIPMSFVLLDDKLYIHTTNTYGHKLDNFKRDNRVFVSAVTDVEACFEETFFTTRYASAMVSGHIYQVENSVEFRKALVALCMKYLPEFKEEVGAAIERELDETAVWAISINSISGKAGRRLKA